MQTSGHDESMRKWAQNISMSIMALTLQSVLSVIVSLLSLFMSMEVWTMGQIFSNHEVSLIPYEVMHLRL